jgi:hypothetical protein
MQLAEHLDKLLMDALVHARMLRYRQLIELAKTAERRVDPWLPGGWRLSRLIGA